MTRPRITILFDSNGPPPADQDWSRALVSDEEIPELEVGRALIARGFEPRLFGVYDDLRALLDDLTTHRPDLVFNLCESFRGITQLDLGVPTVLEMLAIPYTGAGPQGLVFGRDKAISKKILAFQGVRVPDFAICRQDQPFTRPSALRFPLIVKPLLEDASLGVSDASVVKDDAALQERVQYVHQRLRKDAIVEELIHGRELYVGVLGNTPLRALPIVEMTFGPDTKKPQIATYKVKWDAAHRERRGVLCRIAADLDPQVAQRVTDSALTAYRSLGLRDYGRVDVRLAHDNEVYVIEANPNPFLSDGEELAMAAEEAGISYPDLVETIVNFALERTKPAAPAPEP